MVAVVPDLRHVADLVAVEGNVVDVVGSGALACRRDRTAFAAVCAVEHAVGHHLVARLVYGEGLHFGAAVRHRRQKAFHPLRVGLQFVDTLQGGGLDGRKLIRMAVLLAPLPAATPSRKLQS